MRYFCPELETLGAELKLGEHYLDGLDQDVIFRSPASVRTFRPLWRHGPGQ